MANQNVQEALKKFQDTKSKEYEKTQKQINELIGALNKHQSEIENTINREINELRIKIIYDKQKLKHYMTTKLPLQKILQGILHKANISKQNHERSGRTKPQEKKR
jgi:oligoendopeptidase F